MTTKITFNRKGQETSRTKVPTMKTLTINYNPNDEGLMKKLPLVLKHLPARIASMEGCGSIDIGIDQARFHPEPGLAVEIPDTILDLESGEIV